LAVSATSESIRPAVSSVRVQKNGCKQDKTDIAQSKMTSINSKQFGEICNGVWSDRASVLRGRGLLSGETALVRAVFWRLCKAGVEPTGGSDVYGSQPTILAYQSVVGRMLEVNARPAFDGVPIMKELVERYQKEVA
jgi:hypothetical protein